MTVWRKVFSLVVRFLGKIIHLFDGRTLVLMPEELAEKIMPIVSEPISGRNTAERMAAKISEQIVPVIEQDIQLGTIKFFCPGKMPLGRARTLLTKEPETIEWINSFGENDIFWDIGANIGLYSLYAGLNRSLKTLSFEPSPGNYYILNRNIEINKMDDRISAFCLAFNDTSGLDVFYMENTELGGAKSSFAESIDCLGKPFIAALKQAMIGFTIDEFVEQFNPAFPNHIKIDVDGIEDKIINGAEKTLSDKRMKSLLVELDSARKDYTDGVIKVIEKAGLRFHVKKHSAMIETSPYSSIYNYIFARP